jgi:hypothetical protein
MSKRDDPTRFESGSEFVNYAERHGCKIRRGGHDIAIVPGGGSVPIPRHNHIPMGTRKSILRRFVELGIWAGVILMALCIISQVAI